MTQNVFRLSLSMIVGGLLFSAGCANMRSSLREDLNNPNYSSEEPTVGGLFPEGRWMDRGGRGPASGSPSSSRAPGRSQEWINEDARAAAQRDRQRRPASEEGNSPDPDFGAIESSPRGTARATREDFVDQGMTDGSLWASTGQTNYFFTRNRIRSPGDIVTIKVDENLIKNAASELKKALTKPEVEAELVAIRKKKTDEANKGGGRSPAAAGASAAGGAASADTGSKAPDVEVSFADVDPQPSMLIANGDLMMAEIVERYPNGNYRIRGSKRIPYRGTMRVMNLVGIARIQDLNEEDTIEAGKLYEYRVKFSNTF